MPERFAEALKSPDTRPTCARGATSEITVHPDEDIACAKKATDRIAITTRSLST